MAKGQNQLRLEAQLELASVIARGNPNAKLYYTITDVMELAAIARSLHKRYTNMCSYPWADTDAYAERTERLEVKAAVIGQRLGVDVSHNRDPRGWPIIVKAYGYEMRLG